MPAATRHDVGLPLHLLLGAFPVVCFTGALVTDIAYADTADMQWANFSVWLITAGLAMGGLAIVAGLFAQRLGDRRGRRRGDALAGLVHGVGSIAVMLLALWNVFVHSRDAWTSVVPTGLALSVVTVVLMAATGWVGGTLARRQAGGKAY